GRIEPGDAGDHVGRDRGDGLDDQRGGRVPDHRPDAADVPPARRPAGRGDVAVHAIGCGGAGRGHRNARREFRVTGRAAAGGRDRDGREGEEVNEQVIQIAYLVAGVLFVLALKWLSSPPTARRGVAAGEIGFVIAVVATLLRTEIVTYQWILIGLFV